MEIRRLHLWLILMPILVAVLAFFVGLAAWDYKYVAYVPVLCTNDGDFTFYEAPELLTPEHIKAVQEVLGSRKCCVKDGRLFILRSLSEDRDLLRNYTQKAEELRQATTTQPTGTGD